MLAENRIHVGTSPDGPVFLLPQMANRHGLIAGATGTGKTVTLQVLAEGFSQLGVPVFLADVKGDLAGICKPGEMNEKIKKRLENCGVERFSFRGCPVTFWVEEKNDRCARDGTYRGRFTGRHLTDRISF